jgi:hypothetical protein
MSSASKGAMNKSSGNQRTGGSMDDTPGQIKGSVTARVLMTTAHRIDSMGGSEHRGRGNPKRGS